MIDALGFEHVALMLFRRAVEGGVRIVLREYVVPLRNPQRVTPGFALWSLRHDLGMCHDRAAFCRECWNMLARSEGRKERLQDGAA